jgi:hypothetical protein
VAAQYDDTVATMQAAVPVTLAPTATVCTSGRWSFITCSDWPVGVPDTSSRIAHDGSAHTRRTARCHRTDRRLRINQTGGLRYQNRHRNVLVQTPSEGA